MLLTNFDTNLLWEFGHWIAWLLVDANPLFEHYLEIEADCLYEVIDSVTGDKVLIAKITLLVCVDQPLNLSTFMVKLNLYNFWVNF